MAKKFRVRFLSDTTENLKNKEKVNGNLGNCEQGEIFIEKRKLGSNRLLTAGESRSIETSDLATYSHYMSLNGRNFVDSGLHVIDAKAFAPYVQYDVKEIREIDLDKYTEGGFYYIRGEAIPTASNAKGGILLINSPYPHKKEENVPYSDRGVNGPGFAGYLQVIEWSSTRCKQIFHKESSSRENQGFYTRTYIEGVWSEWTLLDAQENLEKKFFNLNPIVISGKPDFDNTTTPGIYWFSDDSLKDNFPKTKLKNGFLIVLKQGSFSKQIILRGGSKITCNDIFIRSQYPEGWSSWLKIPVETFDL